MPAPKCIPAPRRRSSSCHYSPKRSTFSETPTSTGHNYLPSLYKRNRSKSVEAFRRQSPHLVYIGDTFEMDSFKKTGSYLKIVNSPDHWHVVNRNLKTLHSHLNPPGKLISIPDLREMIISHCVDSASTNFNILRDPEIIPLLQDILPRIVDMALDLPKLYAGPIPILKRGDNATISVSRKLCACLLANAFLCTIPEDERTSTTGGDTFPGINFHDLFDTKLSWVLGRYYTKKEKIKCLLSYFANRFGDHEDDLELITFQRKSIRSEFDWKNCEKKLCKVKVTSTEPIENAMCKLQVDFANRFVGGCVIGNGCLQEEVRFAIAPELILSRLFMESMGDDEAVVIYGVKKYSEYSGYSSSFKFVGPTPKSKQSSGDTVVAIDATHYSWLFSNAQYEKSSIDRELHKAYVGFHPSKCGDYVAIATGNWGCGAFNGDRQLKFIIQWFAASANERDGMQYHTFGDGKQMEEIEEFSDILLDKEVTVGSLYCALEEYSEKRKGSVFQYLLESVGGRGEAEGSWSSYCSVM